MSGRSSPDVHVQLLRHAPACASAGHPRQLLAGADRRRRVLSRCSACSSARRRCGCKSDYLAAGHARLRRDHPAVLPQRRRRSRASTSPTATQGIRPIDPIGTGPRHRGITGVRSTRSTRPGKFVVYRRPGRDLSSSSRCGSASGRLGRAWLAIREDELAASMMGVPLMRTKLSAYAVGAFAGGLGGVALRRGTSTPRHPGPVRLLHLDHPAADGRARRHGQRLGRHHRRARRSPGSTAPA